jgi:hypothetical protein
MHHHAYMVQAQSLLNPPFYSGLDRVQVLAVDLNDLFDTFSTNLKLLAYALDHPISTVGSSLTDPLLAEPHGDQYW